MAKKIRVYLLICISLFSISCCINTIENQKKNYDMLGSTVTYMSDKIIGNYGKVIPVDFNVKTFLQIAENELNHDRLKLLKKYQLEIVPHKTYYLLKIFKNKKLIMFDCSCDIKLEGRLLFPKKDYEIQYLEKYCECAEDN